MTAHEYLQPAARHLPAGVGDRSAGALADASLTMNGRIHCRGADEEDR